MSDEEDDGRKQDDDEEKDADAEDMDEEDAVGLTTFAPTWPHASKMNEKLIHCQRTSAMASVGYPYRCKVTSVCAVPVSYS